MTWDFGYQCLRWGKSGHPGIFRSYTLHFLYVGQLGKSVAVLDIYLQSHLCRDSYFVLVALSAQMLMPKIVYRGLWLQCGLS